MIEKEHPRSGEAGAAGALANTDLESSAASPTVQDSFDRIPKEMRERPAWCVWRFEHVRNQAKLTKPPYNPLTRRNASSTDASTWCDFNTCVEAVRARVGWDGVGYMLSNADDFVVIDIDNADLNNLTDWQRELGGRFNSFTEVSPSGHGLHIWVRGKLRDKGRKRFGVEIYDNERYMTVTGNRYSGDAIIPNQDAIDWLYERLAPDNAASHVAPNMTAAPSEQDDAIIAKARTARNGDSFARRHDHADWRGLGYFSQSECDFAHIESLVFYSQPHAPSAEQIARIFRASALGQRPKARRDDYVFDMIAKAISDRQAKIAATEAAQRVFAYGLPTPSPASGNAPVNAVAPSFPPLVAQPFAFRDPSSIPPRDWVYGRTLLRGAVTATIGHGGGGKSALTIVEDLVLVTGVNLLGVQPTRLEGCRVWAINLEDPTVELERRISAAMLHYKLEPKHCGDRLYVNGRETDLCIAEETRNGATICAPVVEAVKENIRRNGFDVVTVDPFVSSHRVSENDNMAIDMVVKEWAKIAAEMNVAVQLVHHSRKTNGGQVGDQDARGAGSLIGAVRVTRTLNAMTDTQARDADIDEEDRFDYFYITQGKRNMSRRTGALEWYKFESRLLGNGGSFGGDDVGVVTRWHFPTSRDELTPEQLQAAHDALADGQARESVQAALYVGKLIATALDVPLPTAKRYVERWLADGALQRVYAPDHKREQRPFIRLADWSKAVAALQ